MTLFESLLQQELESANKENVEHARTQKDEIEGILDNRIGVTMRVVQIQTGVRKKNRREVGDSMDADGLVITKEPKSTPNCGESTQPQGESIGRNE